MMSLTKFLQFFWISLDNNIKLIKKIPCLLILSFILLYKILFSTFFNIGSSSCRFFPSCSDYAWFVYCTMPFTTATWKVIKRLLQCHPLGKKSLCCDSFDLEPFLDFIKTTEIYKKKHN